MMYHVPMPERLKKTTLASLPSQKTEIKFGLDGQALTAALAEEFELKERVRKISKAGPQNLI